MFPRCFRHWIQSHTRVQKEELKKSIIGEAKFVQKNLWIKSYQKMNSSSRQLLKGIKECKCGIDLFIQREHREGKWPRNFVSAPLQCSYEGDILVFYQHCFNLVLKTHHPAGLHEENQVHFSQTQHTFQECCSTVWTVVVLRWWVEIQQL